MIVKAVSQNGTGATATGDRETPPSAAAAALKTPNSQSNKRTTATMRAPPLPRNGTNNNALLLLVAALASSSPLPPLLPPGSISVPLLLFGARLSGVAGLDLGDVGIIVTTKDDKNPREIIVESVDVKRTDIDVTNARDARNLGQRDKKTAASCSSSSGAGETTGAEQKKERSAEDSREKSTSTIEGARSTGGEAKDEKSKDTASRGEQQEGSNDDDEKPENALLPGRDGGQDGASYVELLRRFHRLQRTSEVDAFPGYDGGGGGSGTGTGTGTGRQRPKNEGSKSVGSSSSSQSQTDSGGRTCGGDDLQCASGGGGSTASGGTESGSSSSSSPDFEKERKELSPMIEAVEEALTKAGIDPGTVPDHFWTLPERRIDAEIKHYAQPDENGDHWFSERLVLEAFYYAITQDAGSPTDADAAAAAASTKIDGWLDPRKHVCDWEGITCGLTSAGAGVGKFERTPDQRCLDRCDEDEHGTYCPVGYIDLARKNYTDADFASPEEAERARRRRTIYCRPLRPDPPTDAVTKIDLMEVGLSGTLPPILIQMKWLHRLNLFHNSIVGTIPTEYGLFRNLEFIDLGENQVSGTIPTEVGLLKNTLDELWFEKNKLTGSLPVEVTKLTGEFFDVSGNDLGGRLPTQLGDMVGLGNMYLESNNFEGTIPTELGWAPLKTLDLSSNMLTGTIPTDLGQARDIVELNLAKNLLVGTIPDEIFSNLEYLESVVLSWNLLSGAIPSEMNYAPVETDNPLESKDYIWNGCPNLEYLALDRNRLDGTVPPDMFVGLRDSLRGLDFSHNDFSGSIPSQIGGLQNIELRIDMSNNHLTGTIPWQLGELDLAVLNLTENALTGTLPESLCVSDSTNRLHANRWYQSPIHGVDGCDAILCRPGYFHPDGAANDLGACVKCQDFQNDDDDEYIPVHVLLGQTKCSTTEYVVGDVNGDGELCEAEILRLIWVRTIGIHWGEQFQNWLDMDVYKCDLAGINCKDGHVTKIDLREANLCGSESGRPGQAQMCRGLPSEIGDLKYLEVFDVSDNQFLGGTLPKEIGSLKRLKILDMSECPGIKGGIPTEIGKLKNLRVLNLNEGKWTGTIPTEIGDLSKLEKLNLGLNPMEGSMPYTIGNLESIKEILLSRTHLTGTIPTSVGRLKTLENFELYGNAFEGPLPDLSKCLNLKRIDTFNNKISGPFPESLARLPLLQIVHLKNNRITGTLPNSIGTLPMLSWLDVTSNQLWGTIPVSFATSPSLRDLRIGGNKLQSPVPESLCTNTRVNGGLTKYYGCDAIVCPLGKHAPMGFAHDRLGCFECPNDETTQYLGSTSCKRYTQREFLDMFFDVTGGAQRWSVEQRKGWEDPTLSECDWAGVSCDNNGDVNGLTFPAAALESNAVGGEAFKIYARPAKPT